MFLSVLFSNLIPAYASDKINLLFISSAHSNKSKVDLLKKVADKHLLSWEITHKSARSLKDLSKADALFKRNQVIVFDGVSERESKKTFEQYLPVVTSSKSIFFSPSWKTEKNANKGIDEQQQQALTHYWRNGGRANLDNMLSFIARNALKFENTNHLVVNAPIIFPIKGVYHPEMPTLIKETLDEYVTWRPLKKDKPTIGLLFNRDSIETEKTELIDITIERFERLGVQVVPFYFELARGAKHYDEAIYLSGEASPAVDVIISFRNIHWANQRKIEFEKFGVPVLQAMTYYSGDKQAWEKDSIGVDPNMMAFTLVLPETAGVTDPMIIAAMDRKTQEYEIIDYQLDHLVNKAINLANLKHKANKDKKITVFVWGDKDIGASFLNVPQSLSSISSTLAAEGYSIENQQDKFYIDRIKDILDPFYKDYQLDRLLKEDLAELMPIDSYLAWFNTLPADIREQINSHWGKPQDNFMAINRDGKDYFILPRIRNGNMLVMRQPPRSDKLNDESSMLHQGIIPINHFYLASYFYARTFWNSDAIVHLGTHGSHEYLGGKERGLSMYDQGNLAVWDTPVVYPFIVDDVGEAMQTKRRGRATVISHMTPPFAAAGLHGDISVLHELMHQYKQLDQGGVKTKTAKQIKEKCFSSNLCKDISWTDEQIQADFDAFYDELHTHMESLATATQPLGLHTFGSLADTELVTSTLIQMLGNDFIALASEFEHENYQMSHEDKDDGDHSHHFHSQQKNASADEGNSSVPLSEQAGYKTVLNYIVKPVLAQNVSEQPIAFDDLDESLHKHIETGRQYYADMSKIRELKSMTDFLSGKYIPVKTGGDPIRHPDSLATGYNLYGFDPSKVPTKAAYEQGQELINDMISNHVAKHGKYPDKMAFSLWSIETMRHYGVLEAQALYAMGVKPTWSPSGRVIGTEIIPYSELKRPRVDVVLSATGLYRDAFPNVMMRLAKAVEQVAKLKEDSNPIWKNSVRIKDELIAQGIKQEDAEYLSTVRVFSNESGDYGSGTDELAWASDKWDEDAIIADNYMNKMGYYYGADRSKWGLKVSNSQGEAINLYGKQLSGTDIALLSRSSNVFGMLSSDDPFEYFGSLSLAIRNLDGKSPDMVIANLRNATKAKAEDAGLFMAKELRTRVFHPRWIEEMQKEGYSGAVALSSRMDNFFGWQVVDPNLVRNDQWDEYFDIYVDDKLNMELDKWFEQVNPEALARMMERMLEANRKDYWQASPERLQKLVETYSEFAQKYELYIDNEKLKQHVTDQAKNFGLNPPVFDVAKNVANPDAGKAANMEQVTGQKLEEVKQQTAEDNDDDTTLYMILAMLFIFAVGFFMEIRPRRQLLN